MSGLRKIADANEKPPCFAPDHRPPGMIVLEPGTYEHSCSQCGERTVFVVSGVYCGAGQ